MEGIPEFKETVMTIKNIRMLYSVVLVLKREIKIVIVQFINMKIHGKDCNVL